MDDALAIALDCGAETQKIADVLLPALERLSASHQGKGGELLLTAAQGNRDPLTLLDPQRCSAAYAYILYVYRLATVYWHSTVCSHHYDAQTHTRHRTERPGQLLWLQTP